MNDQVKTQISEEFHKGRQSWEFTGVYGLWGGLRIRVEIKRDSYDFQSYGRVKVFDPETRQWNFLHEIPYSKLAVLGASYVDRTVKSHLFHRDKTILIKKAKLILGIPEEGEEVAS